MAPVYGDGCANFSCSGQGTCITPDAGAPSCRCGTAYAGHHCELCDTGFHRDAMDRCVPDKRCADQTADPCGIHGQCKDDDGVIACACDQGYLGPRCTLCAPGYGHDASGDCLQKVLANGKPLNVPAACTVDACHGHGQCTELDAVIACDCYPGYLGERCESCANGYRRPAGSDRCVAITGCDASACGGCTSFDGDPDFPNHPDTCASSHELQLDQMTLWSTGGEGTTWLCAGSSRYALGTEHVALEAGAMLPAEISFSTPVAKLSFDYAAWDALSLELLGDGASVDRLTAARYAKGSVSLTLNPPIRVLGLRSSDDYAHTLALDNIVYEPAICQ